jgi:hypothetical protein
MNRGGGLRGVVHGHLWVLTDASHPLPLSRKQQARKETYYDPRIVPDLPLISTHDWEVSDKLNADSARGRTFAD